VGLTRYTKPVASGSCPVQIDGLIDDRRRYYFRARGEDAALRIGTDGDMDEYAAVGGPALLHLQIHSGFAAGWMPAELAEQLTTWALDVWCHDNPLGTTTPDADAMPAECEFCGPRPRFECPWCDGTGVQP